MVHKSLFAESGWFCIVLLMVKILNTTSKFSSKVYFYIHRFSLAHSFLNFIKQKNVQWLSYCMEPCKKKFYSFVNTCMSFLVHVQLYFTVQYRLQKQHVISNLPLRTSSWPQEDTDIIHIKSYSSASYLNAM